MDGLDPRRGGIRRVRGSRLERRGGACKGPLEPGLDLGIAKVLTELSEACLASSTGENALHVDGTGDALLALAARWIAGVCECVCLMLLLACLRVFDALATCRTQDTRRGRVTHGVRVSTKFHAPLATASCIRRIRPGKRDKQKREEDEGTD